MRFAKHWLKSCESGDQAEVVIQIRIAMGLTQR